MPEKRNDYWIAESIKDVLFEDVYKTSTEIGKGATSVVYKCEHNGTGQAWAVKVINKRKIEQKVVSTEIGILLKLQHKNIIRLKEIYETPEQINMVLELVLGGELFDRIVTRGSYCEKDAAAAMKQTLTAVKYLHDQGVVHRDLKPENLLYEDMRDESCLKIADFGLSKILDHDVQMNTVCGTPGYCAPEVLAGKKYSPAVDIWSCGVILYILLCGYEPFYADTEREVYKRILKADYNFDSPYWDSISLHAKTLIREMLKLDPAKRITADEALKHRWITGLAAKGAFMEQTQSRIKEFNAARKMRAITDATLLAARVQNAHMLLLGSMSDVSQTSVHQAMET